MPNAHAYTVTRNKTKLANDMKPDFRKIYHDIVAYVEKQSLVPISCVKKYRDFVDFTTAEGGRLSVGVMQDKIDCNMLLKGKYTIKRNTDAKAFKKDFKILFSADPAQGPQTKKAKR